MRRYLGLLGLVALLISVASTVSLASGPDELIVQPQPRVQLGQMYDRSVALSVPPDSRQPSPMPVPARGMVLQPAGSVDLPGPTATPDMTMPLLTSGPALVAPRGGGAISSPKQIADREIRRLIRRLN